MTKITEMYATVCFYKDVVQSKAWQDVLALLQTNDYEKNYRAGHFSEEDIEIINSGHPSSPIIPKVSCVCDLDKVVFNIITSFRTSSNTLELILDWLSSYATFLRDETTVSIIRRNGIEVSENFLLTKEDF